MQLAGHTSLSAGPFGKALVLRGVPSHTISAFMEDPPATFEGNNASIIDQLEDLNGKECLERAAKVTLVDQETPMEQDFVQLAEQKNFAFVFIKPHAGNEKTKALVRQKMAEAGVSLTAEGEITEEVIDKEMLIDAHYGAIAAKARKDKPESLTVQPKGARPLQVKSPGSIGTTP